MLYYRSTRHASQSSPDSLCQFCPYLVYGNKIEYPVLLALFFAIENAKSGQTCAIWAINMKWINDEYKRNCNVKIADMIKKDKNIKHPDTLDAIFKHHKPGVIVINPFYMNERLIMQQGVFVIPTKPSFAFEENLFKGTEPRQQAKNIVKLELICDNAFINDAIRYLNRVNINRATLFPGIDGFAVYLKMLLRIPGVLVTDDIEIP